MSYSLIVFLCFAAFAVASYLLGSVNFAIIITRAFTGRDVRTSGSGNAGMTNVMRTAGFLPGILTFAGDFTKGIAAACLGKYALTPLLDSWLPQIDIDLNQIGIFAVSDLTPLVGVGIAGFFCLLGHMLPVFFGFRGGKGISTIGAIMAITDWRLFLIELGIFLILFISFRIISLGSLIAAAAYPFVIYVCLARISPVDRITAAALQVSNAAIWVPTLFAVLSAVIVIYKHKSNIIRLIRHEEPQLKLKK